MKYVIKDLGVLPSDHDGVATAINNKGQIVGITRFIGVPPNGNGPVEHPFLWEKGRMTKIKTPRSLLGFAPFGINDSGTVLIFATEGCYTVQRGRATWIKPLDGYARAEVHKMNNRGDMVGLCKYGEHDEQPCIWKNGVPQALDQPPDSLPVYQMRINSTGQVVGTGAIDDLPRALTGRIDDVARDIILWQNGKAPRVLKDMTGSYSAEDISDDGTIVGFYGEFLDGKAFVRRKGVVKELKAPEGLRSGSADSINNRGVIAGVCYSRDREPRPVVWDRDGVPTALPTLSGGYSTILDINDAGVIVGMATDKKGNSHAVMWTPVS